MTYSIGKNHRGPQNLGHVARKAQAMTTGSATPRQSLPEMRYAKWFKIALAVFIIVLPLGFMPLQMIGLGFLKPTQISTLFLIFFVPFILKDEMVTKQILIFVLVGLAVRHSVLLVSLTWSPHVADGLTLILIDLICGAATLSIVATASRLSIATLAEVFAWGVLGLGILFHFVIFLGHAAEGKFSLAIALEAITSGELRSLKTSYFVGALQGLGLQGLASFFTEVAPKATNSFGSSIITPTLAAIHLAAADKLISKPRSNTRNWILKIALLNAIFCVAMAYSDRITVYAGLIVLTHVLYFGFVEGNRKLRFVMAYAFVMTVGAGLIYLIWNIAAQDGIGQFIDDFIDNPRFNDLNRILDRLDSVGLLGGGIGVQLRMPWMNYDYPHNLFLADYFSAGVFGLAAALFWFFVIGRFAFAAAIRLMQPFVHSAEKRLLLGAITIFGYNLALTQLSAQGLFDLNDWLGLGIGLLLLIKARQLRLYGERGSPVEFNLHCNRKRKSRRPAYLQPA